MPFAINSAMHAVPNYRNAWFVGRATAEIIKINAFNKLLRVVKSMTMMENAYSASICMRTSMIDVSEMKPGALSPLE